MIKNSQNSTNYQHSRSPAAAFSLVEVVISIFIFSLVSLGLINAVLMSRKQAENLVYDNVALSLVQGYLEQMRSLGYYELYEASLDASNTLDTVSVGIVSGSLTTEVDSIVVGSSNQRQIIVDIVEGDVSSAGKTMLVDFTPTITTISSANQIDALLIKLSYTYTLDALVGGGTRTKTSELRSVVANLD